MPDPASVVRHAPAKLNLTLAVLGRRPDGFHDLHSVFVALALGDTLSLGITGGTTDRLEVEGFDPGPPERNLVLRAIAATRAAIGDPARTPALAARLVKRIPVAAGLGGGSSDAAAAIDGACAAWGVTLDENTRAAIAAELGSDVPYFLAPGPALVEGRGDRLTALGGIRGTPPGVLLVTPALACPTPAVFAALDAGGPGTPLAAGSTRATSVHLAEELGRGLGSTELLARAGILAVANDLLPAASLVVPGLGDLRRTLRRQLGRPIGLSGSGPTLWALYPSEADASVAAEALSAGIASGELVAPGGGPPSIIATRILEPPDTTGTAASATAAPTGGTP